MKKKNKKVREGKKKRKKEKKKKRKKEGMIEDKNSQKFEKEKLYLNKDKLFMA